MTENICLICHDDNTNIIVHPVCKCKYALCKQCIAIAPNKCMYNCKIGYKQNDAFDYDSGRYIMHRCEPFLNLIVLFGDKIMCHMISPHNKYAIIWFITFFFFGALMTLTILLPLFVLDIALLMSIKLRMFLVTRLRSRMGQSLF